MIVKLYLFITVIIYVICKYIIKMYIFIMQNFLGGGSVHCDINLLARTMKTEIHIPIYFFTHGAYIYV